MTAAFVAIVSSGLQAAAQRREFNGPSTDDLYDFDAPGESYEGSGAGEYRRGYVTIEDVTPADRLLAPVNEALAVTVKQCSYCYGGFLRNVNTGWLAYASTHDVMVRDARQVGARNWRIAETAVWVGATGLVGAGSSALIARVGVSRIVGALDNLSTAYDIANALLTGNPPTLDIQMKMQMEVQGRVYQEQRVPIHGRKPIAIVR